jgi:Reverse transcriptase (RNA-dependent DNA polymerase)/gag-polypeptide of LTR copia-type/GAG-pre-integrase domain
MTTTIVNRNKFDTGSITKLNGENYRVWRMRMVSLFTTHKILEIVDGTTDRPALAGTAQEKWDQGNNEALTSILLSMNDDEVEAISGCKTAAEIWRKLSTMYQSVSGESKQILWQKFYSIMASSGKSPVKTMIEIQNYAAQLRSMGVAIDDEAEVARIVSSLMEDKYRQLREAWRSVDSTKQTSALLLARLKTWELEEEATNKSVTTTNSESAGESSKAYSAKYKGKPRKTKEEVDELKKKTKCNICDVVGHWRRECPSKNKKESTTRPKDGKSKSAYMAGDMENVWLNDSGANRHYCGRAEWFTEYEEYSQPKPVTIANNSHMYVLGKGKVRVKALVGAKWQEIELHEVEYVPGGANLFSENVILSKKGFSVIKDGSDNIIYYRNGKPDIQAKLKDGLQVMVFKPVESNAMVCVKQIPWHERLAHVNIQYLRKTAEEKAAHGLDNIGRMEEKCETCLQTKSTKKSYETVEKTENWKPGECLHSDLGYATVTSLRGNKYFLLVKDAGSSFRQVYFQKSKTETVENLKDAIQFISNQTGNSVKLLRTDNGTEYTNTELKKFMSEKGIQHGLNAPHTSQSNGLVERDVRTVQEAARSMLIHSQLDEKHWDDAIATACYVLNRTLSSRNRVKTPFELIFEKKPSLQHTRVFGCKVFAHVMDSKTRRKWDAKAIECILVGYNSTSRNYLLYVPSQRKYIEQAKHVDFVEESVPSKDQQDDSIEEIRVTVTEQENGQRNRSSRVKESVVEAEIPNEIPTFSSPVRRTKVENSTISAESPKISWAEEMNEEDQDDILVLSPEADEMEELRQQTPVPLHTYPTRDRKRPDRYQAGLNAAMTALNIEEPVSYKEAIDSKYADEWMDSMDSEMKSQYENATWSLVRRPKDTKVLKNRWVYRVKTNSDGQQLKFKSRLVVKGFNQVEGLDYEETFAPVARYESIRALLSITAASQLEIIQFDIETAFLNSPLEEETFMEQPEGYKLDSDLVCKLEKNLYGLKQAPRAWHKTFGEVLKKMGYEPLQSDSCIYCKQGESDTIYIGIYVDDGLIVGKRQQELQNELKNLKGNFKLKVQPLEKFLGIEIVKSKAGIFIHQKKYIENMLRRFGMSECKIQDIPMAPGLQLELSKPPDTSHEFQELIGSLLFLSRCTRPDIAYAVHYLSRFFTGYGKVHWETAKKILQYLQGSKQLGILFTKSELEYDVVCGFVDADYGSDRESRKSTTGCLFTFNGAPIVWLSKRQTCIALSSTESEYIALAQGGKEAVWISKMYQELGLHFLTDEPICLKTDSQSAIKLAKNPEFHMKTKHIDIRHHYIRWLVKTGQVSLDYLPDKSQPADILTKSIVKEKFQSKRCMMGLQQPPGEVVKRKAMASVIVDPKRPNMFWSVVTLLMFWLALVGATSPLGSENDIHNTGSPVLWRRTHQPVVVGYNTVKMNIKLISPCALLPIENIQQGVIDSMTKQCEKTYENLFMSELEKICPKEKLTFGKQKRAIVVVAGVILIAVIASAGLGLAGYAVSQLSKVESKQEQLLDNLNDLKKQVFVANEHYEFLKDEVRKVTSQVDLLMNDFYMFKENVVEMQYLVAYLTGKLMEGRKILRETGKIWRRKEMKGDFFEYLNFTMPCGNDCPLEYGRFHECVMSAERDQIILDFSVPLANFSLVQLQADSFELMERSNNLTCRLKYTGPTIATVSLHEDCVYESYLKDPYSKISLSSSLRCRNDSNFRNKENYFKSVSCKATKVGDELDFIQVKILDNRYHVYCPGSVYSIGKRIIDCPGRVFTLPISLTFYLNHVEYKGNVLEIVYKEREDPLLTEHINWHLNPRVNWHNLTDDFDSNLKISEAEIQRKLKNLSLFEFHQEWTAWDTTKVVLIITGVLLCLIGGCYFLRRFKVLCFKKKARETQKTSEEIPLREMEVPVTHRIIIEG